MYLVVLRRAIIVVVCCCLGQNLDQRNEIVPASFENDRAWGLGVVPELFGVACIGWVVVRYRHDSVVEIVVVVWWEFEAWQKVGSGT